MPLPAYVLEILDHWAKGLPVKTLRESLAQISANYRRIGNQNLQIKSQAEALAYALARMPATYAVCSNVLARLDYYKQKDVDSWLDVGSGSGSCAIAAHELYADADITMYEKNEFLAALAKEFLPQARIIADDLANFQVLNSYDVVSASYVLNELSAPLQEDVIKKLWSVAGQALVIIEPGTQMGAAVIARARQGLIAMGAHIAAPCPHQNACPLENSTQRWCHFSDRLERSKMHKTLKPDAVLGYEDEKFSYLIAVKGGYKQGGGGRILGHPRIAKTITLEVCQPNGQFEVVTVQPNDKNFKQMKKAEWGDILEQD